MNRSSTILLAVATVAAPLVAGAQTSQTFNYTGNIVTDTITQSGLYDLDVFGGVGGASGVGAVNTGGAGAEINGDVYLTAGTTLSIVVGQQGQLGTTYMAKSTSSTSSYAGGGGGGTFVYISGAANPLIAAGGGGGAGYGFSGGNAQFTTSGHAGGGTIPGAGTGGTNGSGGSGGTASGTYGDNGGGGGGWLGNGTAGASSSSGGGGLGAFLFTGGAGGTSCVASDFSCSGSSAGGYGGGGGGGYNGGGGGGGYSGGGGATGASKSSYFGGGGGSFSDPSVALNYTVASSLTDGEVILSEVAPVPLPASCWLMLSSLGGVSLWARRRRSA